MLRDSSSATDTETLINRCHQAADAIERLQLHDIAYHPPQSEGGSQFQADGGFITVQLAAERHALSLEQARDLAAMLQAALNAA